MKKKRKRIILCKKMNKNTIWGVKFIYIFMYLLILINRLKIKSKEMSKDFPQTITEMDSWS